MFPYRPEYRGQKSNPAPPRNRAFARAILIAALCCPLPVLALWGAMALSNSLSVAQQPPEAVQKEYRLLRKILDDPRGDRKHPEWKQLLEGLERDAEEMERKHPGLKGQANR